MDALCCASPRKAGGVPTGPLGADSTTLGGKAAATSHDTDDAEMSFGDRALSIFGGGTNAFALIVKSILTSERHCEIIDNLP